MVARLIVVFLIDGGSPSKDEDAAPPAIDTRTTHD
jgi:hypothetical protein